MILTDQLPRNCFRGTPEAYSYDSKAITYARSIPKEVWTSYTFPPLMFLTAAGQHSEQIDDHEKNCEIVAFVEGKRGEDDDEVKMLKFYVNDHMKVIQR